MSISDVFREESEAAGDDGPSPQEQALFGNDREEGQGAVPTGQVEQEPPEPERTHVPLKALEEERHRRQALQREVETLRQDQAAIRGRLEAYNEMQARQVQPQQAEPEVPAPDPEEDPVGYQAWRNDQLQRELDETRALVAQGIQGVQQMSQQQAAQNILNQSQAQEAAFAQEHPDYRQAANFVIQQRREQYKLMGHDEATANALLENERLHLVTGAIQKDANGNFAGWKHNPAERVYQIAQQMGYVAPGTPSADPHQQAVEGQFPTQQPTQQAPVREQYPALSPADRAAMARQGQAQARTGAGTGVVNDGPVTLEDLRSMPESEFAHLMNTQPGLVKHLLGG